MFPRLRILEPGKSALQSPLLTRPPSQWVNKRGPVPSGVERTRLGGASDNLGPGLGPGDLGAPLRFAPQSVARKGRVRFRGGTRPGALASSRGPHPAVRPAGAAALGGFPGRLPRPSAPPRGGGGGGGTVRPAPSATGFVIASPPFPPLAGPTPAGPPSAPRRAEERARNPTLAGTEREPPTRGSRAPGCRSSAGETVGRVARRAPRLPRRAAPHRMPAWGRAPRAADLLGRWELGGNGGALPEPPAPATLVRPAGGGRSRAARRGGTGRRGARTGQGLSPRLTALGGGVGQTQ